MISILLGIILSIGIVTVYIESKNNYQAEDEIARIQENGRYTLSLLKRELTLAGFFAGKLNTDEMTPSAVGTDCATGNWVLDTSDSIELIDSFESPSFATVNGTTLNCMTASDIEAGTDIVVVKRTAGDFTLKNGAWNDGLTAADTTQWYLKVEGYGDSLSWVYGGFDSADVGTDTEVDYWEYHTNIFYVQNYSVTAGDNIPSLCAERLSGNAITKQCLVEGIEDMQIEFGIDTDADGVANWYKAAPTSAEIATAVTARIYLLVRSIGQVSGYTNDKTYTLGEKPPYTVNDGYLRRVFSTTVQMRNATLPAT
jgi:Tfp pilus assembly protein PilW